jgi:outer membrane protein TolC
MGSKLKATGFELYAEFAEAEAQLKSIELEIEEIRLTGSEPLDEVSSPHVKGRDFVTERLRIARSVPEAALELERFRLKETKRRLALGTADPLDADATRARIAEAEASIEAFRAKIDIRRRFLNDSIDMTMALLRVQESEALERQKILAPRVELARKQLEAARRLQPGKGQPVDAAQASLRLQELEAEKAQSELDLEMARRALKTRRNQR